MVKANTVKYKFYWKKGKAGMGGVAVLISESLVDKVVEVERHNERVIE